MITTISLVNICHHTVIIFFPVMRSFKIYSLSNFQICNMVLLIIVTMLYITSPRLIYNWELYLLTPLYPFCYPLPPSSGNYQSVLCIYELGVFLFCF